MVHQNRRETHIVGQVIEINWRTTRLKTTEKTWLLSQQQDGWGSLINYMQPKPYFRIDLEFVLDYVSPNRAFVCWLSGKITYGQFSNPWYPEPEVRLDQALIMAKIWGEIFIYQWAKKRHIVNRRVLSILQKLDFSSNGKKSLWKGNN